MQTPILALLLAAVLALFLPSVQIGLRSLLKRRPGAIWAFPFALTGIFAIAAVAAGALNFKLVVLVLAYTCAPVLAATGGAGLSPSSRRAGSSRPHLADFAAILLLWLPLEFAAGASLVPRHAQGFLHSVGYGLAIVLALALFLGYRQLPGMKYSLPRVARDLWLPLAAFAALAPILAVVGISIGFIPPPHLPVKSAASMAAAAGIIFAGTALPEEILFRSLIQNLIMRRFGENGWTLAAASAVFGCAHLNNGPQPAPNWRYMILATIAGWAYGRVFQKSCSVTSPAALHMLVDWTKHFFF
jgi:uncharacterized protein